MGDLSLKIGGQVDDMNCTKRAFLWADTTTNTKSLGDIGNLRIGSNFYTEFASPYDWTGLLAFLTTFLRTLVCD